MKTFTATDARNKFGEFLDTGMVEGVKVVRNNRTLGYFIPEREYEDLRRAAANSRPVESPSLQQPLSPEQLETLKLYSQGKITSTEAKTDLRVDRRGLIRLVGKHGLLLPHLEPSRAERMAREALEIVGVTVEARPAVRSAPHG